MTGWHVVISKPEMLKDMIKSSDDVLSVGRAVDEVRCCLFLYR